MKKTFYRHFKSKFYKMTRSSELCNNYVACSLKTFKKTEPKINIFSATSLSFVRILKVVMFRLYQQCKLQVILPV